MGLNSPLPKVGLHNSRVYWILIFRPHSPRTNHSAVFHTPNVHLTFTLISQFHILAS